MRWRSEPSRYISHPEWINATSSRVWGVSNPRGATPLSKTQTQRSWRAEARAWGARRPTWFTQRRARWRAPLRWTRCCWSTPINCPRRSWPGPCSSGWRWTAATATSPTLNVTCRDAGSGFALLGPGYLRVCTCETWQKESFRANLWWGSENELSVIQFWPTSGLDYSWNCAYNPPPNWPKDSDLISVVVCSRAEAFLWHIVCTWISSLSVHICTIFVDAGSLWPHS